MTEPDYQQHLIKQYQIQEELKDKILELSEQNQTMQTALKSILSISKSRINNQ